MKAHIRRLLPLLVLLVASSVSALDFGLDVSNDSMLSVEGLPVVSQANRARAWTSIPFGGLGKLFVSGFYEFSGSFQFLNDGTVGKSIIPLRIDLDRSDFEGSLTGVFGPSSMLTFAIGRADFGDFSSRILSGLSDGVRAELALGNLTVKGEVGYRGFLSKGDARSFINATDQAINDAPVLDPTTNELATYLDSYFAPKRAFLGLGADVTEILKGLDAGLELWGQLDLNGVLIQNAAIIPDNSAYVPTNTLYAEPYLSMKIGRLFSWKAWGIYELGIESPKLFSSLAAGSQIDISFPAFLGLRLSQNVYWATGAIGGFKAFTPIRTGTLGSVNILPFSDAMSVSVESFLSPFRNFYTGLSIQALFRSSDNTPSTGSFRADATGRYLGAESNALVAFYPTSDLMLSTGVGIFLPNTATMYVEGSPIKFSLSISASLSL